MAEGVATLRKIDTPLVRALERVSELEDRLEGLEYLVERLNRKKSFFTCEECRMTPFQYDNIYSVAKVGLCHGCMEE